MKWLVVILTAVLLSNIIWIALDQSPPLWDIAGHSERSLTVAELMRAGNWYSVLTMDTTYPPLAYSVTALVWWLAGHHADVPHYSLLLWVVVYGVALYDIARRFFSDNRYAVLTVGVSLCYPLLAHFTRIYDLDFPLTAMVVASTAALLRTNELTNRRWVIGAALLVAAALLTKWTAVIFLAGPLLGTLIVAWRSPATQHTRIIKHLLLASGIVAALTAPWYVLHYQTIVHIWGVAAQNSFTIPTEHVLSLANVLYYLKQMMRGMSWPLGALAIYGASIVVRQRLKTSRWPQAAWLPLLWFGVGYILITFVFTSKESRYILPLYPVAALFTVMAVQSFSEFWKKWSVIGLVCFALSLWVQTSFGVGLLPRSIIQELYLTTTYGIQQPTTERVMYGFTSPTAWHTAVWEIPNAIMADRQVQPVTDRPLVVAVVPNSIFLTSQQVYYAALLKNLGPIEYRLSTALQSERWRAVLPRADYIITKTGEQGPKIWRGHLNEIVREERHWRKQRKPRDNVFAQYELIQTWPLNGIEKTPQEMRLYRRLPSTN